MSSKAVVLLCAAALAATTLVRETLLACADVRETAGQSTDERIIPKDASEQFLVQKIKGLESITQKPASTAPQGRQQMAAEELLLLHVDELLKRYPKTVFKDEALIAKLRSLAHLARANPARLDQLLKTTGDLGRSEPRGELASENAFYAIQAFLLGARREGMPEQRRLQGMIERYRAFLDDHPSSPRVAVVHASLIRNLLAADNVAQAMLEFSTLQGNHPEHPATRRASGEVGLRKAVGQPFKRVFTTSAGRTIRAADHLGKVFVIHFWESSNKPSKKGLAELIELYKEHHAQGLELVSINLDDSEAKAREAVETSNIPWVQYHESKGSDSDIVIDSGVIALPTCFVLDRNGTLRMAGPCRQVPALVQGLLTTEQP